MSSGTRLGFWYCLRTVIAGCSLFVGANYAFSVATVYQLSHPQQVPTEADAAIVLGAAAWDKRPSPVFRERINHAINLYRAGIVKKFSLLEAAPEPVS
ncbi:hypothetical protein [Snodgrassella alvi]|uniref:hypothetical protein n=1 Tax=Snodgrassella alvi TaxID=1196083 RepID=UPI00314068D3